MNVLSVPPDTKDRTVMLYITAAVLAVAVGILFLLARYQERNPPPGSGGPVIIPGMVRPGEPDFEYYKNRIRLEGVTHRGPVRG